MDLSYTYATRDWERVSVYAPPGLEPPDTLELTGSQGQLVEAFRLTDQSLVCTDEPRLIQGKGNAPAKMTTVKCGSPFECHRTVLGECACGLHAGERTRIERHQS